MQQVALENKLLCIDIDMMPCNCKWNLYNKYRKKFRHIIHILYFLNIICHLLSLFMYNTFLLPFQSEMRSVMLAGWW